MKSSRKLNNENQDIENGNVCIKRIKLVLSAQPSSPSQTFPSPLDVMTDSVVPNQDILIKNEMGEMNPTVNQVKCEVYKGSSKITEIKAHAALVHSLYSLSKVHQMGFIIKSCIGWGGNGTLLQVSRFPQNNEYAIKIIYKTTRSGKRCFPIKSNQTQLPSEIRLLSPLQHSGIIKFHEWFEDDDYYYMVIDYIPSIPQHHEKTMLLPTGQSIRLLDSPSDLYGYLESNKTTSPFIKRLIRKLSETIAYLHQRGISHGDIKEENILIHGSLHSPILCDFGHAHTNEKLYTLYGTTDMTAPELLKNLELEHKFQIRVPGFPLDVWALGLLLFGCLGGEPPENGVVNFKSLKRVSGPCLDVLKGMLNPDPRYRITIFKVLGHE